MKNLLSILVTIGIITSSPLSYGDAVTYLPKGSPAPYDGFLFTREHALQTRKDLIEFENTKPLIESFEKTITNLHIQAGIQENQIDTLLKHNNELSKRNADLKTRDFLETAGIVVITTLVIYGAIRVGKEVTK